MRAAAFEETIVLLHAQRAADGSVQLLGDVAEPVRARACR